MNKKDFTKMALIMALSTSLFSLSPVKAHAEGENLDSGSKDVRQENKSEEEELREILQEAKEELDNSETSLNDSGNEKALNDKAIGEKESDLKNKDDQKKSLEEDLDNSLVQKIKGEEDKIEKDKAELQKTEVENKEINEELIHTNNESQAYKNQKEEDLGKLEEYKKGFREEDLEDDREEARKSVETEKSAKEKLEKTKEELKTTDKNIKEINDKKKLAQEKLLQKEEEIEGLNKQIGEKEKSLAEKKKALEEKEITSEEYGKLSQEIEDLKKDASKKQDEINNLSKEIDQVQEQISDAEEKIRRINEANGKDEIIKDLEDQKNQKLKEKTSLEEENKNLDKEIEELSNKEKKFDQKKATDELEKQNLEQNLTEKEKAFNTNKTMADKTSKELEEKKTELSKVKDKLSSPLSEEEKAEAIKQWEKGSVGFFEANGSYDALDVFKKEVPYDNFYDTGANSAAYIEANKIYTKDDSRDLDRMKASIDAIEKLNKIRQEKGGIDGRKLSIVGISDFEMAVAQANANYSQNRSHAKQYNPPFENLYWSTNPSVDDALEGWYSEDVLFKELRKRGYKSKSEMTQALNSDEGLREELEKAGFENLQVGHYTNIVDHLMWPEKWSMRDSKAAGYAIRPSNLYKPMYEAEVHSLVLNHREGQEDRSLVYSVEEYKEKFNKYYEDLKARMEGKRVITEEDEKSLQILENEVKSLEEKVKSLNDKLATSIKEVEDAELALKNKSSEIQGLDQSIEELKKDLGAKEAIKEDNSKSIETLDQGIKELEVKIEDYKKSDNKDQVPSSELEKAIKEKKNILEEKETSLASLKEDQKNINQKIQDDNNKLSSLDKERLDLENSIKGLEAELSDGKVKLEESKKDLGKINESLKDLDRESESLADRKNQLETVLEESQDDLDKKTRDREAKEEKLKNTLEKIELINSLEEAIKKADDKIKALEERKIEVSNKKTQNEAKIKSLEEKIEEGKKDLEALREINLDDYDSLKGEEDLRETYERIEEIKQEKKILEKTLAELKDKGEELSEKYDKDRKVYAEKLAIYKKAKENLETYKKKHRPLPIIPQLPNNSNTGKYGKDEEFTYDIEAIKEILEEIKRDFAFNEFENGDKDQNDKEIKGEKELSFMERILRDIYYYNIDSIDRISLENLNSKEDFVEALLTNIDDKSKLSLKIADSDLDVDQKLRNEKKTLIKDIEVLIWENEAEDKNRADFVIGDKYFILEGSHINNEEFFEILDTLIDSIKRELNYQAEDLDESLIKKRDEANITLRASESIINNFPNLRKAMGEKLSSLILRSRFLIKKADFILKNKN